MNLVHEAGIFFNPKIARPKPELSQFFIEQSDCHYVEFH